MGIAVAGRQGERRRSRDQHADHRFRQPRRRWPTSFRRSGPAASPNPQARPTRPAGARSIRSPSSPRSAPNIHVIGDACLAGAMPKSAFSANSRAKTCARAIATLLSGGSPAAPKLINTCYSLARRTTASRSPASTSRRTSAGRRRGRGGVSGGCATRFPRARPTMRNPGFRRSRRKSLAKAFIACRARSLPAPCSPARRH